MIYIGGNRVHIDEIDSTNHELKRKAVHQFIPNGTLLTASFQTTGKGQMGAIWESQKGKNLLATYYLEMDLELVDAFSLNMIMSLAVKETIESFVNDVVEIKWPNDIIIKGKKIAGILIETKLVNGIIKAAYLGVGLNVNQTIFNTFKRLATSIKKETGLSLDIEILIQKLNLHLQQFYSLFKTKGYSALNFLYHQDLYLKGEEKRYLINTEEKWLILQAISKSGKAQFYNSEGKVEEYDLKEIEFVQ